MNPCDFSSGPRLAHRLDAARPIGDAPGCGHVCFSPSLLAGSKDSGEFVLFARIPSAAGHTPSTLTNLAELHSSLMAFNPWYTGPV